MKNCATCKFMNYRCKGQCGDCVNRVVDNPSGSASHLPLHKGGFYKEEAAEEKCKCMECYDEDSGKYKYWVGDEKLMQYFGGVSNE